MRVQGESMIEETSEFRKQAMQLLEMVDQFRNESAESVQQEFSEERKRRRRKSD